MPDDQQKTKVYEFEEELADYYGISGEQMSIPKCQEVVNHICSFFAVHPPEVKDGRGRNNACADTLWIRLPKKFRNLIGVVHECCHVIHETLPEAEGLPDHSPVFVRYFVEILRWHLPSSAVTTSQLTQHAELCGVDVAPPEVYRRLDPEQAHKILGLFNSIDKRSWQLARLEDQAAQIRDQLEAQYGLADAVISAARQGLFQ